MRSSKRISESHFLLACRARLAQRHVVQSGQKAPATTFYRAIPLVLVAAALTAMPILAPSQALVASEDPSATTGITNPGKLDLTYLRPTEKMKVNNYAFDAFGPYPIAGTTLAAGINQWSNAPPEWNQGVEGFGKRFGSDFAIATIGTTTRYGLAEAFRAILCTTAANVAVFFRGCATP